MRIIDQHCHVTGIGQPTLIAFAATLAVHLEPRAQVEVSSQWLLVGVTSHSSFTSNAETLGLLCYGEVGKIVWPTPYFSLYFYLQRVLLHVLEQPASANIETEPLVPLA